MKVIDALSQSRNPLISYEIIPPRRGGSVNSIMSIVEHLVKFDPPFIDVTSHSAEVYYEELPDGTLRRYAKRKRPGTLGLCAAIKGRYGIETVPHLLCLGFSREETEDALIELNYLGIQNVMALRGDDSGYQKVLNGNKTRNVYASDLVHQIADMNRGVYLESLLDAAPTDFCVGVAGYPEKHFEAPNRAWDIQNLKKKVDSGAAYVTTQMFFDNRHYFSFVKECRAAGIDVPIIPGIKVLTSKRQLHSLPRNFHVEVPAELAREIGEAPDDRVKDVGIEWAIRQSAELMSAGVPCVHFYIMQSADVVTRVVEPLRMMA